MQDKTYYGNETVKAIKNFGSSKLDKLFIKSFAEVKKACLTAIQDYSKKFDDRIYQSIIQAINKIIAGEYNDQFVLPFKQGGAGTSINMNFNEVISNLAEDLYKNLYNNDIKIDPIEDINLYQSTNDVYPTALTVMAYRHLQDIEYKIILLQETLIKKENEYSGILVAGRTEMQDALPITLGQIFGSWAGCIERDRWRLNKLKERIRTIALGGTAIGTCFFAPSPYVFIAEKKLREITGLPLCRSQNLPDEISNLDKFVELSSAYSIIAQNLFKITGDLLLYTSSFIHEINQPSLQYGSTIMAAKTNPVILEYVRGLAINIQGEATKILNYSQNGQLQLNAYLPFITECFINMHSDIINAVDAFINKFLALIEPNINNIERNLVDSHVLLNTLIPVIGYNKVKEIYKIMEGSKIESVDNLKSIIKAHTDIDDKALYKYFHPIHAKIFLRENNND